MLPFWSLEDVEGVVAVLLLLPFWSVEDVELVLLWLEGWVALWLCDPVEELELLPVCAARHKLASNRGEASHIFFIFISEGTSMVNSSDRCRRADKCGPAGGRNAGRQDTPETMVTKVTTPVVQGTFGLRALC